MLEQIIRRVAEHRPMIKTVLPEQAAERLSSGRYLDFIVSVFQRFNPTWHGLQGGSR